MGRPKKVKKCITNREFKSLQVLGCVKMKDQMNMEDEDFKGKLEIVFEELKLGGAAPASTDEAS